MWHSGQITIENHYTTDAGEHWFPLSELTDALEAPALSVTEAPSKTISKGKSFGLSFFLTIGVVLLMFGLVTWAWIYYAQQVNDTQKGWAVTNSWLDGSVYQARDWLKQNLNDPGSLQIVKWYPVERTGDNVGYIVHCDIRAKNSFGAYVVEKYRFNFDGSGAVTFGGTDEEFFKALTDKLQENSQDRSSDSAPKN